MVWAGRWGKQWLLSLLNNGPEGPFSEIPPWVLSLPLFLRTRVPRLAPCCELGSSGGHFSRSQKGQPVWGVRWGGLS